jgi:uncharacterized repeat protein (TIGR02543 family)
MDIFIRRRAPFIRASQLFAACLLTVAALAGCTGGVRETAGQAAAPTISGTPVTRVAVNRAYNFTPTVSNPSGMPLTFSIHSAPPWATFKTSTGQLGGTPSSANVGTYPNIVISVTNGNSPPVRLPAFSLAVVTANAATSYTVTYDGNDSTGGAPPAERDSYAMGATVTVLGNTANLARTGYTFSGWNTGANGTGTAYAAGNTFKIGGDVTLYAQWKPSGALTGSYTVTYDGNDASGGTPPAGNSYASGSTVTVLGNIANLARTGYTFSGWNTAANGTGTAYAAGNTFKIGSNITLYAKWAASVAPTATYTVTYNGNGSTGGAPPTGPNSYATGAMVTVLGNTANLVRTGYTFSGWNTATNGAGTAYAAGSTFKIGSNVTLYADWAAMYTVAYNGNGSTRGAPPAGPSSYATGTMVTVLGNTANLARTGYTFSGWNTATNGAGTAYAAGRTFKIASNVMLYADWAASVPQGGPSSADPTTGVLPSYNDAYANWNNAGLQSIGGIPNRTTVCATVNPLGGGQDDFTNVQNAINNCKAGGVVQLGAGAFSVHLADLPIHISTGITLRGTGDCGGSSSPYCQTSISVSDGALAYTGGMCGTSTSSKVSCPNGGPPVILMAPVAPDYNYSWAKCGNVGAPVGTGCGAIPLATDAAQGQTTIQVTSSSNFSVGQWVLIDEASGAGWVADPLNAWTGYGSVWAAPDWLNSSGSPATGRVLWSKSENRGGWDFGAAYPYQASSVGCWHSYCDRPTAELHKISSVGAGPCPGTGCTLTFDDPLTIAFRQSGNHNAQVYGSLYASNTGAGSPISLLQSAGVENVSVLRGVNGGMEMELCAYCWIKNTEVGDWYGGGINVEYSARSELNTVYVHHCWNSVNNGGEYPIALDNASTEILITNSITNFGGKGMVARAGGAGSVVSYSYVDDTMYDAESGIGDYWLDMGLNASHYSGPHHVLFEGDWADNLDNDNTHGNSTYITFFRNESTGMRTPFTDPSIGKSVDDSKGTGFACGTTGPSACAPNPAAPLRAAGPMAYNYWFAFAGNVLGLAGETTAANGWTYQGDWSGHRIFMPGWNAGPGGQDPYLNGVKGSYIFRSGNYDYVNDSIADWTPGYSHTLPNSFYLPSAPAFFSSGASCTYSWPWVTPTGSTPIQRNSCGGSGLPAKARYEAGTPFKQP